MSIFKTIGTKLKRVISLKNVINGVTGNYAGIALDAKRVLTTKAPSKKGVVSAPSDEKLVQAFDIPVEVSNILNTAGAKQAQRTAKVIAQTSIVQNNLDGANKFMLNVWWDATWLKYKTYILIGLALITVFIGWKVLGKKSVSRGRARR